MKRPIPRIENQKLSRPRAANERKNRIVFEENVVDPTFSVVTNINPLQGEIGRRIIRLDLNGLFVFQTRQLDMT